MLLVLSKTVSEGLKFILQPKVLEEELIISSTAHFLLRNIKVIIHFLHHFPKYYLTEPVENIVLPFASV